MRFSPSAATRLGVKPNSEMRAATAASATPSTTSALTTSSSCRPSKKAGRACGARVARGGGVEDEPADDRQQEIEADQSLPLHVDGAAGPRHRGQKHQQEN